MSETSNNEEQTSECGPGEIMRKGYHRKGYQRRDYTRMVKIYQDLMYLLLMYLHDVLKTWENLVVVKKLYQYQVEIYI